MKKLLSYIIQKLIIYTDILIHRKKIKKFLSKLDANIKVVYDVGSNNGDYSLLFNEIFPKSKIFSFEPNPKLYEQSLKKLSKYKNTKVIKKAVGNSNKNILFKIDKNSSLTSSLAIHNKRSRTYRIKKFLYGNTYEDKINIKLIKLDTFIKKKGVPNLVKIDVEGFEEEVLKGISKNLKKIEIIMIEFHFDKLYKNYSTKKLHKYLIKNKFKHIKSIKFPILNWEDRFYRNYN